MEYPKTENLFNRGPHHKVQLGDFRCPEFQSVNRWRVTEKIDGMNMRVIFDPGDALSEELDRHIQHHRELYYESAAEISDQDFDVLVAERGRLKAVPARVTYRGRTDNAMIPPILLDWLNANLPVEKLAAFFKEPVILFGEGYGGSIQKGHAYRKTPAFRLFDVFYNDDRQYFASPAEVDQIATGLGIPQAPLLGIFTTDEAVKLVQDAKGRPGDYALTARAEGTGEFPFEGIIAVADPVVFDRFGKRVKFKLKVRDL